MKINKRVTLSLSALLIAGVLLSGCAGKTSSPKQASASSSLSSSKAAGSKAVAHNKEFDKIKNLKQTNTGQIFFAGEFGDGKSESPQPLVTLTMQKASYLGDATMTSGPGASLPSAVFMVTATWQWTDYWAAKNKYQDDYEAPEKVSFANETYEALSATVNGTLSATHEPYDIFDANSAQQITQAGYQDTEKNDVAKNAQQTTTFMLSVPKSMITGDDAKLVVKFKDWRGNSITSTFPLTLSSGADVSPQP